MDKAGAIVSKYQERYTLIGEDGRPQNMVTEHTMQTMTKIPKFGVMMVGLGGNNGTTVTAGILANRNHLKWQTKKGEVSANYYGSFTQCVTTKVGMRVTKAADGTPHLEDVYRPVKEILPLVEPNDIVISGWDISSLDMFQATRRAQVLEPDLIRQLEPELRAMRPLSAVFNLDFVAANQKDRADNVKRGTMKELVAQVQHDIAAFKAEHGLEKILVLWTANTEKYYSKDIETIEELDKLIEDNASLPPSVIYGVAALREKAIFINGSPQNTVHPALIKLAAKEGNLIAGSDFKSGQTKYKTVMGEFLIGSGMRCASVVSYNHLGNNDGKNLSDPQTFRSKEKSKASVLDDCLKSNPLLYPPGHDKIDHLVVIKYCPYVGDSKRALDEYTSEIFLNGQSTIVSYNICEDSLLAAPIMIDLCIMGELMSRISVDGKAMGPVMSYLSYFFKAPVTNHPEYVINILSKQKEILTSFMKACAGYAPDDSTLLSFHF